MIEVLESTRSQEPQGLIPENLIIQTFDKDSGSGIATLSDGGRVVAIGEGASGAEGAGEAQQQSDLTSAAEFIKQRPDVAAYYGFAYVPPKDGGLRRVIVPGLEQLNERKNALPPEIGVNQAEYVSVAGGDLPIQSYLGYFANNQVPEATEPKDEAHDACTHDPSFGIMSHEFFEFFAGLARDALAQAKAYPSDPLGMVRYRMANVGIAIDQISALLTRDPNLSGGPQDIAFYLNGVVPTLDLRAVTEDLWASQQRTNEALQVYLGSQDAV